MPSTVIKSYHYDKDEQSLTIVFIGGNVYEYQAVPEEVYIAFKAYREKGIYLNKEIKGKFSFKKLG
jgi:hypothetical protein